MVQYCIEYPVEEYPVVEYYGGDVQGWCFRHREGACDFSIPIGDQSEVSIVVSRLQQMSTQMDSDVFNRSNRCNTFRVLVLRSYAILDIVAISASVYVAGYFTCHEKRIEGLS